MATQNVLIFLTAPSHYLKLNQCFVIISEFSLKMLKISTIRICCKMRLSKSLAYLSVWFIVCVSTSPRKSSWHLAKVTNEPPVRNKYQIFHKFLQYHIVTYLHISFGVTRHAVSQLIQVSNWRFQAHPHWMMWNQPLCDLCFKAFKWKTTAGENAKQRFQKKGMCYKLINQKILTALFASFSNGQSGARLCIVFLYTQNRQSLFIWLM